VGTLKGQRAPRVRVSHVHGKGAHKSNPCLGGEGAKAGLEEGHKTTRDLNDHKKYVERTRTYLQHGETRTVR